MNLEIAFEPMHHDLERENQKKKTLPWIEKFRPQRLGEILHHDRIIQMLRQYIKKKSLPHLLFYGPPGTGKTSTIMACARELYGDQISHMVMELNASDDRGIDVVRSRIRNFVMSDNIYFGSTRRDHDEIFKLVILDETDAMTYDAQAILRKVVEKYSYNARFCLICNSNKKIITPLQSRCATYRFAPLSREVIKDHVYEIAHREKIKLTSSGAELICRKAGGDMRRALNTLQTVSMAYSRVDENNISTCLCYPKPKDVIRLLKQFLQGSYPESLEALREYQLESGISLGDIIGELEMMICESLKESSVEGVMASGLSSLSLPQKARLLSQMRVIEYQLLTTTDETIQMYGLVALFKTSQMKD